MDCVRGSGLFVFHHRPVSKSCTGVEDSRCGHHAAAETHIWTPGPPFRMCPSGCASHPLHMPGPAHEIGRHFASSAGSHDPS